MKFTAGAEPGIATPIPRNFHFILLAITLLCLLPRLILGLSQYVEYDGYWHVWIAQQPWHKFISEYQSNAHPPLYFLLLKLTFWLGRNIFTYRLISIASGAASVYFLGLTAMRAMRSPVWAGLAALAYGLAMPSIILSNEVRTYMLSAFFVQVSFWYFLDLIDETQPASLRSRVLFGLMATLACLTEYYALIYVGAALLFAFLLPLVRRQQGWLTALCREALTFALILALPVWEFVVHFHGKPQAYQHLPEYYFQRDGAESALGFLLRNIRNELNGFSPLQVPEGSTFYAVLLALALLAAAIVFLTWRGRGPGKLVTLALIVFPLVMMSAIMFGGLERLYPFGGLLRQQYILFPFFAIWPFLLPDRLLADTPRMALFAVVGVLAAAIGAVSYRNYRALPKDSSVIYANELHRYNRLFPAPEAVYIDQFNLTTFFMHRHNWAWDFVGPLPGSQTADVYKLAHGGHSMMMFRDRERWNLDLRDPGIYDQMANGMRTWRLSSCTIFCLTQMPGRTRTESQVAAYRARIAELSARAGLCLQTLDLDNYDAYAEFRSAGSCAPPRP